MARFPTLKEIANQFEGLAKLYIQTGDTRAIKTGRLRDSIRAKTRKETQWKYVVDLDTLYYGVYVNFGTRFMKSRPFATKAADSDVLKSMIDGYNRKIIQTEIFDLTKKKQDKIWKKMETLGKK